MYEPVHGSAPDIAGQGIANPIATILSFGMALRYSFDMSTEADLVDNAVQAALSEGCRTGDIANEGEKTLSTHEMGSAIISQMEALSA